MQYDIHPEELDEIGNLAKERPLLYHKLKDVQTIYQGFFEFLRKRYITAEEVLDLLCEKIGSSRLVRDSWIALDGFTGFTPVQNKLLRELLKLAQQVWVTAASVSDEWGDDGISDQNGSGRTGGSLGSLVGASGGI